MSEGYARPYGARVRPYRVISLDILCLCPLDLVCWHESILNEYEERNVAA